MPCIVERIEVWDLEEVGFDEYIGATYQELARLLHPLHELPQAALVVTVQ
jgi:hypothetical protein